MNKTYFFMSGLPRSGSTLLKSILNQNPEIHCSPISPVLDLMFHTQQYFLTSEQALAYPKPNQEKLIISDLIKQFYSDKNERVIIDHSRAWVNNLKRIEFYITETPKILCPVRDILEILTSFITLVHKNQNKISFIDKGLIKANMPITDDNRCEFLMSSIGIVGLSMQAFREGYANGHGKYFYNIEYEDLICNPEKTLDGIYNYLELDYYKHDLNCIENNYKELDSQIWGIDDMHKVRKEIKKISPKPKNVLTTHIMNKYVNKEFWRKKYNTFLL